ncbi:MAG TPA: patatin-like phospholipase family protein [Pseudonocardiaceae bacterium]
MAVPLPAGDPDVLDVLVTRRDTGSRPGRRTDGLRTALVVEGGGMRGAYTGGMVRGLAELRLRDSFDEIFGTSSGAYVAAAFATGQGVGAATIYADDLSGTRFIDYRRPLAGRGPVMHFDYLIDTVLATSKPLDFDALAESDVPVRPIATLATTLRPYALADLVTPDLWRTALRATARIPVLAGPPVRLHDRTWIDGSLSEPIALRRAVDGGATHVLALLSRTRDEHVNPAAVTGRMLTALVDRAGPGLGKALRRRGPLRAETVAVFDDAAHPLRRGARLLAVRPPVSHRISALTSDPDRLRRAADTGTAAIHAAFATR